MLFFYQNDVTITSTSRFYTLSGNYRCLGSGYSGTYGLTLQENMTDGNLVTFMAKNPYEPTLDFKTQTSSGYYVATPYTLVSSGVPYYSESGAEGFFFAGYGTDFNEKLYSENLGFIAKTSESGIGISNCITT